MSRIDDLKKIADKIDGDKKTVIEPLLDEIVFLEEELKAVKKLPFLRVDKKNPQKQEETAAGKQYKAYLQQYNNCIRVVMTAISRYSIEEDDAFDMWLKEKG